MDELTSRENAVSRKQLLRLESEDAYSE
jgi:hypothetical protein